MASPCNGLGSEARAIRNVAGTWVFSGLALIVSLSAGTFAKPAAASETLAKSAMLVKELKTEHLSEPLGIQTAHPRFQWLLDSAERGQLQIAYQVLVATTPKKLQAGIGDDWDSGKIASDNSVEVPYAGRALASAERAYWKVRVWDREGKPGAWSKPSSFEMGLLKPSDWQGKWIAAKQGVAAPLFRNAFSIGASIRRARVYISGLGYYELYINGKKVGDRVLDPAPTYYNNDQPFKLGSRALYSTYDVTDYLRKGANAVGVMLGNGWYTPAGDPDMTPYGKSPQLIMQMNIELNNGRTLNVFSDGSWKTSTGPITYNDLVNGESYDARLEQPGWDHVGFDDSAWETVTTVEAPNGALTAQTLPPERVIQTLPAVRELITRDRMYFYEPTLIYDFGQNFSGWVRLTVSGPRGTKLVFRYGARLFPEDDSLDTRSNGESRDYAARQADAYILSGRGREVWEPRFTQHGFRYVEVKGLKGEASIAKIEGRVVHSALEISGYFVSSNDLLNKIHHNNQWTFASSFQGIMQDAADRAERFAWLGDPAFVAEDYIDNYDMRGFWEKWLKDIQDGQKEDGSLPVIFPVHLNVAGSVNEGLYDLWPSWQSTYPLLVWYLYRYYDDRRVVAEHYESLKKLTSFFSSAARDGLIPDEILGDHMEPQEEGFSIYMPRHTPNALTANAHYYETVWLVAQMAKALGRTDDAKHYESLAADIKAAFNRRFFNSHTNQYATGSQTSNALPLSLEMVPAQKVSAVMKNLMDDIVQKHNTHVSTGIIGTNAVVQVLPELGANELMYRLATQTTFPSLGRQVMMGATTVCATWECNAWDSQNMKMFGSLDKFFYRNLAGIAPASPGYRRVLIKPQPAGDLKFVKATQKTVRGNVSVEWTRKVGTSFDLKVTIPAGMEADIEIPTLGLNNPQIAEGGTAVWNYAYVPGTPGLTGADATSDSVDFHAGSGSYHFTVRDAPH